MLKLVFFVPDSHLESVKRAVFDAGAGEQGEYSNCAFQTQGVGQFIPSVSANPTLGARERLERVEEWRVEVLVPERLAAAVKGALLAAHPYETVAYDFTQLIDV